MSKTLLSLLAAAVLAVPAAASTSERSFTPLFDFSLGQSLYVPTGKDTFFSGGNINTNVGLLTTMDEWIGFSKLPGDHALFALYSFNYTGPSFTPQDQGYFEYRTLGHNVSVEYRWKMLGPFRLRPGIGFSKGFVRSGANETWGTGLYDNTSKGGQLALDYMYSNGSITGQYLVRKIEYPNFTDLLREFQSAGQQSETSGGLQDQSMKEMSLGATWKKLFAGVRRTKQDYDNEKVVESNGTYGSTAQENTSTSLYAGFTGKLWAFEIQPQATYTKFESNQNFLQFREFNDPSPTFFADWNSYTEYRADVPFYINFTKAGSGLTVGWSIVRREYENRPARDANNNALSELQENTMVTLSGGFRFRINEVAYMKLLGGIVKAESNNKFESYLPYNYTGLTAGLSFNIAY